MAAVTAREAAKLYGQHAGKQPQRMVEHWLQWLGGLEPSDTLVEKWMAAQEQEDLKRGTIDRRYRAVRAFYAWAAKYPAIRYGGPIPTARSWHFDSEKESESVAFGEDTILRLVEVAKEQAAAYDAALLCLSTLFGLRAVELSRVLPEDCNLADGRLFVKTAKKGVVRWHWLPEAARPWLDVAWPRTTAERVERVFPDLWALAGLEDEDRMGSCWHGVRHGLDRALRDRGVPEEDRDRFCRWKGNRSMARRYANVSVVVGLEGPQRVRGAEEGSAEYDAAVWLRHPFVEAWR